MLTPDYLLHISEGAEQISAQLHTDILKDIVRRIQARQNRGDNYVLTATDKWQIEALMDAGYLRDDIAQDIARATGLQQTEIAEAFEDAGVTATRYDDRIYEAAGISTTPLQQSPHMIRLMQRNYEATMGEWRNFTRTTADAAQTAFIDTMDQIYNRVLSGASGYTSAFVEAIDKLASDGLFITYPSGHRDTIETATLRCVRTGVSQATAQIQTARMDEYDIDLVVVSSHMGARPDHEVWQGKVYSRSGNSRKYPDFVSSTGYGTGAGLCGWNCRHSFSPYFEGMDNPFLDYDSEENRKAYEESQQQRAMERAIRKTKRRQEVLQDAADTAENDDIRQGLNNKLSKVKERLRMQNTAYREYCDDHGLRPLPERLRIAKAQRYAAKEGWKRAKEEVENIQKGNIIDNVNRKMKLDLQFFSEKNIHKQSTASINKGIRSLNDRIREHQEFLNNPKSHVKDWDDLPETRKNGLIRHWNKEIRNFKESIEERNAILRERGELNE